jgi:hypothetical protein
VWNDGAAAYSKLVTDVSFKINTENGLRKSKHEQPLQSEAYGRISIIQANACSQERVSSHVQLSTANFLIMASLQNGK